MNTTPRQQLEKAREIIATGGTCSNAFEFPRAGDEDDGGVGPYHCTIGALYKARTGEPWKARTGEPWRNTGWRDTGGGDYPGRQWIDRKDLVTASSAYAYCRQALGGRDPEGKLIAARQADGQARTYPPADWVLKMFDDAIQLAAAEERELFGQLDEFTQLTETEKEKVLA